MNRVLLSQMEQLKCNFCTQWFSVQSQFASLQKYSLNACQKCLADFKYRLVDPSSFEIYDVVLIKTGIELTSKQYELTKKFDALLRMHRETLNINQQSFIKLKDQDSINCDLKAEVNMHTLSIKERVSQICRKLLDGVIKKWNDILTQMQKGSLQFDDQKQNLIKILADRYYNFNKDSQKLLSQQRIQKNHQRLRQISQQVKKLTSQMMLDKIKNFVGQFFGINLNDNTLSIPCTQLKQNKQNKTPNQKRNLRNIRQKLMRNSRKVDNNELKVNESNIKSIKKSNAKSSKKNLLKPQIPPLMIRKKSQKSLIIKTPRSFQQQQETQKQKPIIDQYRGQVSKLLKQKDEFESYMPVQPQKNDSVIDRTYGQKCLVEYLVQLRMKTTVNENICQLINQNLSKGNLACFLKSLQWKNSISLIRFVKVKFHDAQFDTFLNWLSDKQAVQILVITNNFLTDLSVQALYSFCLRHRDMSLRQVYLGNNYIKPSRARKAIQGLKSINIQVYI